MEYLSPGVFIEEESSGPRVIQGVATSSMGIIGPTKMGPTDVATLTSSFGNFQDQFGSFGAGLQVPLSMVGFFANGGSRAYVVRVTASDAVLALVDAKNSAVTLFTFKAISKGVWGNGLRVVINNNTDYLDLATGKCTKHDVLIQLQDSSGNYVTKESYLAVSLTDATDPAYMPNVVNAGSKLISVVAGTPDIPTALNGTAETATIGTGDGTLTSFSGTLLAADLPVMKKTFKITAGALTVTDDGTGKLTGNVDPAGTNTIDYATGAYSVKFSAAPANAEAIGATFFKDGTPSVSFDLATGSDGVAGVTRSQVSSPALESTKQGIYALDAVDEILQLVIPDFAGDVTVAGDQIAFAEGRKDRFVILTTPKGFTPQQAVDYIKYTLAPNTSYAALYYPWVTVKDPLTNLPSNVPPLGHVAGVYARTDSNRNVGKNPGGTEDGKLNFQIGLERVLTKAERNLVYPARINPLISSAITGTAVWGVRTLALDSLWRYVNARRLFMFLEKSIYNSTQWVTFENNGPDLQGKLALQLDGWLSGLFANGYFAGATAKDAYYVKCDAQNNPQEVVDAGQIVCEVAAAPNKPGEFVIFRFSQQTAQA